MNSPLPWHNDPNAPFLTPEDLNGKSLEDFIAQNEEEFARLAKLLHDRIQRERRDDGKQV